MDLVRRPTRPPLEGVMLAFGLMILGLATFAAMLAFVAFCDWV